jgi:hypothetical protein
MVGDHDMTYCMKIFMPFLSFWCFKFFLTRLGCFLIGMTHIIIIINPHIIDWQYWQGKNWYVYCELDMAMRYNQNIALFVEMNQISLIELLDQNQLFYLYNAIYTILCSVRSGGIFIQCYHGY